jgi:hypothetical protein
MSFKSAVINSSSRTANVARTQNGMKALKSTLSNTTDLFFKIGASRGKNIVPDFTDAYVQDRDIASRIALWARDARGGAGERKLFRDILKELAVHDADRAIALMQKAPYVGRWDDLLVFEDEGVLQHYAFEMIRHALEDNNGLCAKWMPRKGSVAAKLRAHLGWSP